MAVAAMAILVGTSAADDGDVAARRAPVPRPATGDADPRIRVDPDAPPWRGVGKIQATTGDLHTACTGALVAPAVVLTAAHCVYNIRTRRYFTPASLHFLVGYRGGAYEGHALGVRLVTAPGYDPAQGDRTRGSDWALLTIDKSLGTGDRVLAIREAPLEPGAAVAIGGYSGDHPVALTADTACRIVGAARDGEGRLLLRHDCTAPRGDSGAPLLVREGATWRIAGIHVATAKAGGSGIAVPVEEARKQL